MYFRIRQTLLIFIVHSLVSGISFGQHITTDTVYMDFTPDSLLPVSKKIISISDNRGASSGVIGYSTIKKFVLIPVDQEVTLRSPLTETILRHTQPTQAIKDSIKIKIDYYIIEKYQGRLATPYILNANLEVYSASDDSNNFMGTLCYHIPYQPTQRKTPQPEVYEHMMQKWHETFKLDLISLQASGSITDNFIDKKVKPHYLNTTIGAVYGLNFWQLEAEMYFTRPETDAHSRFTSNIIRYQNTADYEALFFGKKAEHFYLRRNDRSAFDISTHLMIGINKWKIVDEQQLWQIPGLALSSNQSYNIEPCNGSGLVLKIGAFENLTYIIGMPLKFYAGMYLATGYKF